MNAQERAKMIEMGEKTLDQSSVRYANYFIMEKGDNDFRGGTIGGHEISDVRPSDDDFDSVVAFSGRGEPLGYCSLIRNAGNEVIGMVVITDLDSARDPDGKACYEFVPKKLRGAPIHNVGVMTESFGFG